jgi:hypothetical protein
MFTMTTGNENQAPSLVARNNHQAARSKDSRNEAREPLPLSQAEDFHQGQITESILINKNTLRKRKGSKMRCEVHCSGTRNHK